MQTATEVMMSQIATLTAARDAIQKAIDEVTGSVNPCSATWGDVSKLAYLVDCVKRSELVTE